MGYIIAAIVFLIGLVLVAFFFSGRGGRTNRGRIEPAGHEPVERAAPAAEEATPAASSTADPDTAARAQRRTPAS